MAVDPSQMRQQSARRKFTAGEDEKLKDLVERYGTKSWEEIAQYMPERSARQCRDRFKNYLDNELISDPWQPHEDQLLLQKYREIGPKWVEISRLLPGRSGNTVKNRWHKHLSKSPGIVAETSMMKERSTPVEQPKISSDFVVDSAKLKHRPQFPIGAPMGIAYAPGMHSVVRQPVHLPSMQYPMTHSGYAQVAGSTPFPPLYCTGQPPPEMEYNGYNQPVESNGEANFFPFSVQESNYQMY
jgi:hypothetical protein